MQPSFSGSFVICAYLPAAPNSKHRIRTSTRGVMHHHCLSQPERNTRKLHQTCIHHEQGLLAYKDGQRSNSPHTTFPAGVTNPSSLTFTWIRKTVDVRKYSNLHLPQGHINENGVGLKPNETCKSLPE
jgi:hypothetical protein